MEINPFESFPPVCLRRGKDSPAIVLEPFEERLSEREESMYLVDGSRNLIKKFFAIICLLFVCFCPAVRGWANSDGDQRILLAQNVPRPPSDLRATVVSKGMIELVWKSNSENGDGFRIYCNNILIGSVGKNITTFQHKDLEPGKLHRYEVRAFNSMGESEPASLLETPPYEEHY